MWGGSWRVNTRQDFIFKDHEIVCRNKDDRPSSEMSPIIVLIFLSFSTLPAFQHRTALKNVALFLLLKKRLVSHRSHLTVALVVVICFTLGFCSSKVLDLDNTQVSLLSGSKTSERSMISGLLGFAHELDHILSQRKLSDEGRQL